MRHEAGKNISLQACARKDGSSASCRLMPVLVFLLILGQVLVPLHAYGVTESCAGNSMTVNYTGIANAVKYFDNDVLVGGTLFCDRSYTADFPVPGKPISVNVSAGPMSTYDEHLLTANIDGLQLSSSGGCNSPDSLATFDVTGGYCEANVPFAAIQADLRTWNYNSQEFTCQGQDGTWLSIDIEPNETYCAGDASECRYT